MEKSLTTALALFSVAPGATAWLSPSEQGLEAAGDAYGGYAPDAGCHELKGHYGCGSGWCWKQCASIVDPTWWAWTAWDGGYGEWASCETDEDCDDADLGKGVGCKDTSPENDHSGSSEAFLNYCSCFCGRGWESAYDQSS